MKLCDATVFFGRDLNLEAFQHSDVESLGAMLDKYRVERALVISFASFRLSIEHGNDLTFAAARAHERLVPCPTVVPNSSGEVGSEKEFVKKLVRAGARAVGFYPRTCGIALDERVVGRLFRAVQAHRLPVLMQRDELELPELDALAQRYPDVPFVYCAPNYRHRNLYPLFESTQNLHLTIAGPFAPNEGIEDMVRRFGSRRLLYASNYPISEPGVAIGQLCYADIRKKDRENIACRNMQRLMEGVRDD